MFFILINSPEKYKDIYIILLFCAFFLMIQGTPVNIIVGSHVWVEDPEVAWIDGEVIDIKGKDATIVTTNGKTVSSVPNQ